MNNLIEKTVKHLSKTAERIIPEKSMTDAEIEKLLSDTENAVDKIINDMMPKYRLKFLLTLVPTAPIFL